MDRFIALQTLIDIQQYFCLKSNMDRFIVYNDKTMLKGVAFKIQYG